jgi:hypothetical protein
MVRKVIVLIAMPLVVSVISTAALAQSKRTTRVADRDVKTLVLMMDKDKDGTVSKDEFLAFMGREFDRLDVDKSGTLEPGEVRPMRNPTWPLGDCVHVAFPQCSGGD